MSKYYFDYAVRLAIVLFAAWITSSGVHALSPLSWDSAYVVGFCSVILGRSIWNDVFSGGDGPDG